MKRLLVKYATASILRAPLRRFLKDRAMIFMFHRFRTPDFPDDFDPEALQRVLEHFHTERLEVVPLLDLVHRLRGDGPAVDRCVALTIDDGYADQAEIGAPVFAKYDVPVTTFVTTGFLDRDLWMWWDRIDHIFRTTLSPRVVARIGEAQPSYPLTTDRERAAATQDFTARCKGVTNEQKDASITRLARLADVELPREAPDRYAPMTWDQLRACRRGGMSFGPHTITHPILSRAPAAQSTHEILGSWARLQSMIDDPTPIFCYPNGLAGDYGTREVETLREAGFEGAVIGSPGYPEVGFPADPLAPFAIPRFGCPPDEAHLVQITSGLERLKQILRLS